MADDDTTTERPITPVAWQEKTMKADETSPVTSLAPGLNDPVIPHYDSHDKLQTSHRGQYSIQRMLALHEYTQRVSTARALAVCVLTPLPALAIAILLQVIKVQPYNPFAWKSNTPFWIAASILSFIFSLSVTVQARKMLTTYPISLLKAFVIAVVPAAAMVLILGAVAKAWWFPVPFSMVLGVAPFLAIWFALFFLLVRRKAFPEDAAINAAGGGLPLGRFFAFILLQCLLITWFAAFEILIVNLEKHVLAKKLLFLTYQSWRNFFKHTVACYLLRHCQDFVPEMVVFTVELFVALYLFFEFVLCYDEGVLLAVLGSIFLGAVSAYIHLNKRLKRLAAQREHTDLPKTDGEMMQAYVDAFQRPHQLDANVLKGMRLHGTGGHDLPNDLAAIVDNLQSLPAFIPSGKRSGGSSSSSAVVPLDPSTTGKSDEHATAMAQALHQTLTVLFNTEYLVLIRYVEFIVPLLYMGFVLVVVDGSLPALSSFPYLAMLKVPMLKHLHHDVIIFSLIVSALQILLWGMLWALLKARKVGVSPLKQLAFVLENQQLQIQAKLIAYLAFAVHFVMIHYGSDFSIKFAWKAYFP